MSSEGVHPNIGRKLGMEAVTRSLVAFVLLVGIHSGCTSPESKGNVGVVQRGDIIQKVTLTGSVRPVRKSVITAPYQGYVHRLYVKVGDSVKLGAPIVAVGQSLKMSHEEVFPIRAPLAGTVVQVMKSEGEAVETISSEGRNQIVRIDDLSTLYVDTLVPEMEISKLKLGQRAEVRAGALDEGAVEAVVTEIALSAKEQERWDRAKVEFPVSLKIVGKRGDIRPGMSVSVSLIADERKDVLKLSHEYIQKRRGKAGNEYFVVKVNGERVLIQLGLRNDEEVEVMGGLNPGDQVKVVDFTEMETVD